MFFFRTVSSLCHEGLGDQRVHVTPYVIHLYLNINPFLFSDSSVGELDHTFKLLVSKREEKALVLRWCRPRILHAHGDHRAVQLDLPEPAGLESVREQR